MSVINSTPLLMTPEGYQISRSVRLRSSASAYLNRTPASASNFQINTLSFWAKRGSIGSRQALFSWSGVSTGNNHTIEFTAADAIEFYSVGTAAAMDVQSSQVFRDPSAWYHIVYAIDTTQATAANRIKLYVNGAQVTAFGVATYPAQNASLQINANQPVNIGRRVDNTGAGFFGGYLTEVNFIDGQALTPSSFGETDSITGVWKPKKYAGTYGTNGFYLNFSDPSAATAAAIGKDYSGNGNNWTPNNISVTAGVTYDSMVDVPTMWADGNGGRGNYCTLNSVSAGTTAISAGNLKASAQTNIFFGTLGATSGKWYYEAVVTTQATGGQKIGIATATATITGEVGDTSTGWAIIVQNNVNNGQGVHSGSTTSTFSTFTTGDVVNVAYDIDAGKVWFGKNGTWFNSGAPASGTGAIYTDVAGEIFPAITSKGSGSVIDANFGQRPFAYTPPTGFKALNTQNLPEGTIKKGNQYFDATLYTGNGSNQTITNGGFQPDFFWGKSRSAAGNHGLVDAVRGGLSALYSNLTNAETSDGVVTAWNSNGVSLGNSGTTNANGVSYVGWQWKESASAGFDIVTYTGNGVAGRTIAHNLGVAPSLIIAKCRSSAATNWPVFGSLLGVNKYMLLNSTAASTAGAPGYDNGTLATSSVFSVGNQPDINGNTATYVAYLFAEVAGFSKFGSYVGNGSADGPFVFTGFRPRYILVKDANTAGAWGIFDTARMTTNVGIPYLQAQASTAELAIAAQVDFLSNGFKLRADNANSAQNNLSGNTYIFAAFAENPFKNSLAR